MVGQTTTCPHCGLETKLFFPQVSVKADSPALEAVPSYQPQANEKSESDVVLGYVLCFLIPIAGFFFGVYLMAKKKAGHGAACMAISIVLGLLWVVLLSSHGIQLFSGRGEIPDDIISGEKNLQPVQGAYGWNLGDMLPGNFETKTNDDGLGITSDFDPEGLSGSIHGWLTLTEERRIAAIYIFGIATDQRSAVDDMLKQKYGFRERRYHSKVGYDSFFGTTNRQAVLQVDWFDGKTTSLEYRDEELVRLADKQKENRKAAAQKKIGDELKTHL